MNTLKIIFGLLLVGTILSCSEASLDQMIDVEPIDHIVTYNSDIERIMDVYCVGCHAGPNPTAGLSLSTYEEVRNGTEQGTVMNYINNTFNPMPTTGLMPPLERRLIEKWITDGFLEL